MTEKDFCAKQRRTNTEAAKLCQVSMKIISANNWKAKNKKPIKKKELLFYRLLMGLDIEILNYFLDDNNFIKDGVYLKTLCPSYQTLLTKKDYKLGRYKSNRGFNMDLLDADPDELRDIRQKSFTIEMPKKK